MTLEEIRSEIKRLSGSGKRVVGTRLHGIYSSFTLPGLDDMMAVRDTKKRFDDFGIPENLFPKTFLDLGANVGAMAFEAANRGAQVIGLEYREDRVRLCEAIANMFATPIQSRFFRADFNDPDIENHIPLLFGKPYDIVLCCSVDEYISNVQSFYNLLRKVCRETLYFECNRQRDQDTYDTINMLKTAGFHDVTFLGNGHSGGSLFYRQVEIERYRSG